MTLNTIISSLDCSLLEQLVVTMNMTSLLSSTRWVRWV